MKPTLSKKVGVDRLIRGVKTPEVISSIGNTWASSQLGGPARPVTADRVNAGSLDLKKRPSHPLCNLFGRSASSPLRPSNS
ncbi:hypothetical protein EYF80_025585 [Liparis tanakae]|uniref:Uncharacterized protein n=1 Tax=Liparis tanakae TaxID=230148 RepID=A0A4Z2HEB8_9TELE|nr:hypothetical protein EYF80_025585 [Liparis tanakae]